MFGAAPLRPEQEQAVNAALDNRDVLVVLPTGFGKSRCYQVPALLEDNLLDLPNPRRRPAAAIAAAVATAWARFNSGTSTSLSTEEA